MPIVAKAVAALSAAIYAAIALLGLSGAERFRTFRWPDLVEWFVKRADRKTGNPDVVAFAMLRRPEPDGPRADAAPLQAESDSSAPVLLVQGFFNSKTSRVIECRLVEAHDIDDEVRAALSRNEVVIFE